MVYNRTLIEAASWRLASIITRRHSDLALTRILFHGGNLDVLWLRSTEGLDLRLNRNGGIRVLKRHDGVEPAHESAEWTEFLTASDPMEFVEKLEHEAGLLPAGVTPPTQASLIHSALADILGMGVLRRPFEVTQGFLATDGTVLWPNEDGFAIWWPEMLALDPDLEGRDASHPILTSQGGLPLVGLDFWRIERDDFQLTFDTVTGSVWTELEEDPSDIHIPPGDVYVDNWVGTINDLAFPEGAPQPEESNAVEEPEQTLRLFRSLLELGLR